MGSTSLWACALHITSRRYTRVRICLNPPPTSLYRDFHHPDGLPSCVPPSLKRFPGGTGILTCFPSATPLGLTLGTDLPWADDLYPGNLRLTASGILTRFIVTHVSIIPCTTSSSPLGLPSQASAMLTGRTAVGCARDYADMSNDKAGENPARRKPKVSWVKVVCPGQVGP